MYRISKMFNRQRFVEILPHIFQRHLQTVAFRRQCKQFRMLTLATRTALIHHHTMRDITGHVCSMILFNHGQHHI